MPKPKPQFEEFYALVQRAESRCLDELEPVFSRLKHNDVTSGGELLHRLYLQHLSEDMTTEQRAQALAFFTLLAGRLHEVTSSTVRDRFTALQNGFFLDLASEAMIVLSPEPRSPTAIAVSELRTRLLKAARYYRSKYFNLEKVQPGWTAEEFARAVLALESLPKQKLLELVDSFQIRFTDSTSLSEEALISVLFDDVEKTALLNALENHSAA